MIYSAAVRTTEIEETGAGAILQGIAASGGVAEGPCRVVTDIEHLTKIDDGSILVFATSAPSIAPIMARLAGLVTAEGGLLGGAAYYARERGIPCVTAVKGLMEAVCDGTVIRIDGHEGTVTLL